MGFQAVIPRALHNFDYKLFAINRTVMSRNYNLEILRIISAFGIVLLHGVDGTLVKDVGFSCLIIFMLITSYLLAPQKNYSLFITKRATRLLIPWIFWFFVYGLINIISGKFFLPEKGDIFSAVLTGTKYHLWYLPFTFITSIIIVSYYNLGELRLTVKKYNWLFFMLLSIIFLIISPLWRPWSLDLGDPWGQWFLVLPAVFIGTTIANLNPHLSDHWIRIIYVILIMLISIWLIIFGQPNVGIRYMFGFLLFVSAVYLKFDIMNKSEIIMTISNCTYGIYLIHPLIYSIESKLGFSQNFIVPYATYALSLLIIILANKMPMRFIKKII